MATKTLALSEILDDEQVARVTQILNSPGDSIQMVQELKEYLIQFREHLENEKGVVPEYLAYAIVHNLQLHGMTNGH